MKIKRLLPLVIFLFASLLMKAGTPKIAYIYAHDMTRATEYQAFLTTKGYDVSLFDTNQLGTINFADFSLIMIGENSGYLNKWGDHLRQSQITGSGLPILGLGEGGYAYFGTQSLNIGWGLGSHFAGTSVYIPSPGHQIFTSPNLLSIPSDSILALYTTSTSCVVFYPFSPGDAVSFATLSSGSGRCVLVQQTSKYFLWGFDGSPSTLTDQGKLLLLNVINFMKKPASGISEIENPASFDIYPNPVANKLNLEYSLPTAQSVYINIRDISGNIIQSVNKVHETKGLHHIAIDLSGIASGLYFCEIELQGTKIYRKFMVQ